MVMVSIVSPFMISYLTSIVSSIVSLVVFESDVEILLPRSRTIQGHLRSKVMVLSSDVLVISSLSHVIVLKLY